MGWGIDNQTSVREKVEVYLAPVTNGSLSLQQLSLLGDEENQRLRQLPTLEAQRRFVASHVLLRRALSKSEGYRDLKAWSFRRTPRGQWVHLPSKEGAPAPYFSLSHCGQWSAVAISRAANVGIDLEKRSHRPFFSLDAAWTRTEKQWLQTFSAQGRAEQAIRLWTAKEAVTKLTGLGIDLDPESFSISLEYPHFNVGGHSGSFKTQDLCFDAQDWAFTVAVTSSQSRTSVPQVGVHVLRDLPIGEVDHA